jgi:uncharacterized membrane-anchored protein
MTDDQMTNDQMTNDQTRDFLTPSEQPQTQTKPAIDLTEARPRLPVWRFWVPLLFQAAFIIAVPAQDAVTYATGTQVVLQTAPVDPYDPLRGYYQTLGYEISDPRRLKKLPGSELLKDAQPREVYIVLQPPARQGSQPPKPWQPVRVSADRPRNLAANQVAIQGKFNGFRLLYDLETYYMPEDQRQEVNQAISQVQGSQQPAFVVEVKVDGSGNAVPVSLWVRDRNYRF